MVAHYGGLIALHYINSNYLYSLGGRKSSRVSVTHEIVGALPIRAAKTIANKSINGCAVG